MKRYDRFLVNNKDETIKMKPITNKAKEVVIDYLVYNNFFSIFYDSKQ